MENTKSGGFTACGQYYSMEEKSECYIEYCKKLLNEIRSNSKNNKNGKRNFK